MYLEGGLGSSFLLSLATLKLCNLPSTAFEKSSVKTLHVTMHVTRTISDLCLGLILVEPKIYVLVLNTLSFMYRRPKNSAMESCAKTVSSLLPGSTGRVLAWKK